MTSPEAAVGSAGHRRGRTHRVTPLWGTGRPREAEAGDARPAKAVVRDVDALRAALDQRGTDQMFIYADRYFDYSDHKLPARRRDLLALFTTPDMEASRFVSCGLSRLIARQGWIGVTLPDSYGGMGMGHLAKTVIIEELARVSGAMGAMVQASQLGVAKIVHFGNEEQKKQWLPAIAAGDCLPTIAVTEPESGRHVLGMTSSAVRDGEDYLLNGHEIFVGNSHVGDLHGIVVRTGPGSKGLSAFLVESDRPGFSLGPQKPALGLHGSASES